MGLNLKITGNQININTTNFGIIQGYEFNYSVPDSKYAKGSQDNRELIIKGSISQTLQKAPEVIEQLRKWAKTEYTNTKDKYYHSTTITVIHADTVVREITFPDAFIKDYKEEIDPLTGDGTYTITLMQKLDKRIDVVIDPFNEVHPSLSAITRKRQEKKNKTKATTESETNSPYWVEQRHLVPSVIRVIRPTDMYSGCPSITLTKIPNSTITRNDMTDSFNGSPAFNTPVIRARRDANNMLWFLIFSPNQSIGQGWIPQSLQLSVQEAAMMGIDSGTPIVSLIDNPAQMIVTADDAGSNSIRSVWGRGIPANGSGGIMNLVGLSNLDSNVNGGGVSPVIPSHMATTPTTTTTPTTPTTTTPTTTTPNVAPTTPPPSSGLILSSPAGLVDGTLVRIHNRNRPVLSVRDGVTWVRVDGWSGGRGVENSLAGQFRRMRLSQQGMDMLEREEMDEDTARSWGLGIFDENNEWVGIYPHYVFRQNTETGRWESDGGITFGHGIHISQRQFNMHDWARNTVNTYAPGASFAPPHIPHNGVTFRVPESRPMSMESAKRLFEFTVPRFEDYLNNFLEIHGVQLHQHQFDALIIFSFNFVGNRPWTQILDTGYNWNIAIMIMENRINDREFVELAFTNFTQNQGRRRREFELFINGHQ